MLSNIIMGFTTALSPANLIAVLGGDHTWYLLWGDARSVGYNGDCGTNTGFPTVPTLIGLYSISQLLGMIVNKDATVNMDNALSSINKYKFRLRDICCYPLTYLWCGIVGCLLYTSDAADD